MKTWDKFTERYWADLQRAWEQETVQLIDKQLEPLRFWFPGGEKSLETFIERLADRRKNLHIKPEFTPQVVKYASKS